MPDQLFKKRYTRAKGVFSYIAMRSPIVEGQPIRVVVFSPHDVTNPFLGGSLLATVASLKEKGILAIVEYYRSQEELAKSISKLSETYGQIQEVIL